MRYTSIRRFLLILVVASFALPLTGCANKSETTGPEMGSIEAYLEEHPEELQDDPDEAGNEDDEFDAGS